MNQPTKPFISLTMLLVMLAAVSSVEAKPDPNRCYAVKDADLRRDCLARTKKDRNQCLSIRNADQRRACEGATTGDKNRCLSIRDADQRRYCESGAGW